MIPALKAAKQSQERYYQHRNPSILLSEFRAEFAALAFVVVYLYLAAIICCALQDGKWSFTQGLYFGVTTLCTVGYGDITLPDNTVSRLFNIALIWTNLIIVAPLLSTLGSSLAQGSAASRRPLLIPMAVLSVVIAAMTFTWCEFEGGSLISGIEFAIDALSTVGHGRKIPTSDFTRSLMCPLLLIGLVAFGSISFRVVQSCSNILEKILPTSHSKRLTACLFLTASYACIAGFCFRFASREGWTHMESFYFAVMTMMTVGYGDFAPTSAKEEELLSILYMLSSVTLLAVVTGIIGAEEEWFLKEFERQASSSSRPSKPMRCKLFNRLVGKCKDIIPLESIPFCVLHFGGMLIFSHLESWNFLDSLYFTTATLSTVGYGDIVPETVAGRWAAICMATTGVPVTAKLSTALSDKLSYIFMSWVRLRQYDDLPILLRWMPLHYD